MNQPQTCPNYPRCNGFMVGPLTAKSLNDYECGVCGAKFKNDMCKTITSKNVNDKENLNKPSQQNRFSHEYYVQQLMDVAKEIELRAEEIVGDIDGVTAIKLSTELSPDCLTTIMISKEYVSGRKKCKAIRQEDFCHAE